MPRLNRQGGSINTSRNPDPARRSPAAERLVADFAPRLFRYALVRLRRADLAEDAVGETLCRLVDRGPDLDGSPAHVRGWCVRCLVNVCRELERRPRPADFDETLDTRTAEPAWATRRDDDGLEQRELIQAMGGLSPRQREAVILRILMDHSVAETAEAMGCAHGTVKALTHQGLRALYTLLADTKSGVA